MEKVFVVEEADEKRLWAMLQDGFWKADWRIDLGWPLAYKVTFTDEALMRGFILYVRAVIPSAIILD